MKSKKIKKGLTKPLSILAMSVITAYSNNSKADDPWSYKPENIHPAESLAVLGFNSGVNGLVCGITAAVEKRDVVKDSLKCAAGGAIQFGGMILGSSGYPILPGLGSQFISLGTDWINNTLEGRNLFEKVHQNIGPLDIYVDTTDGSMDAYWSPMSVVGLIYLSAKGNKLNLLDSLSYQTLVFNTPYGETDEILRAGQTIGNTFSYDKKYPQFALHENIHRYRYNSFYPAETLSKKILPTWSGQSLGWLENYAHINIMQELAWLAATTPQNICKVVSDDCGFKNYDWLEWEANTVPKFNPDFSVNGDVINKKLGRQR